MTLRCMDTLNAIHEKMHKTVQAAGGRIDAIFYCPHGPHRRLKTGPEGPSFGVVDFLPVERAAGRSSSGSLPWP